MSAPRHTAAELAGLSGLPNSERPTREWLDRIGVPPLRSAPMLPETILALIRRNGGSPTSIAKDLGVTVKAVSRVIREKELDFRIALRIAEVTGWAVDDLWPARYVFVNGRKPHLRLGLDGRITVLRGAR